MSKVLKRALLSCLLLSSVAVANENNIGADTSSGDSSEKNRFFVGAQAGYSMIYQKFDFNSRIYTSTGSYANYGILAGYEMWFMKDLGLRAYTIFGGVGKEQMHYGGGVDAIYNFMETNGIKIGAFAGAQVEGTYWRYFTGSSIQKETPFGFNVGVNVGARFSIDNHVAELAIKVPFINDLVRSDDANKYYLYRREMLSMAARYMYRF